MSIRYKIAKQSEWNSVKSQHHIGKDVTATVVKAEGFGAICEVGARRLPAILRNREISWDPRLQSASRLQLNSFVTARVIGYQEDRRELILSIKAANTSAIREFEANNAVGSIVTCEVTGIFSEYKVALEGGVEGFIGRLEVAPLERQHEDFTARWELCQNDRTLAMIERFDESTNRIELSIVKAIHKLDADDALFCKMNKTSKSKLRAVKTVKATDGSFLAPTTPLSVFLVEDEKDILHTVGLSFRMSGHRVTAYRSVTEALATLGQKPMKFDVAVLDFQIDGFHGKDLVEPLRKVNPAIRLAILTGNDTTAFKPIAGTTTIRKPIDLDELVAWAEGRAGVPKRREVWVHDEMLAEFLIDGDRSSSTTELSKRAVGERLMSLVAGFSGSRSALVKADFVRKEVQFLNTVHFMRDPTRWGNRLANSKLWSILIDRSEEDFGIRQLNSTDPLSAFMDEHMASGFLGVPLELVDPDVFISVIILTPSEPDLDEEEFADLRRAVADLARDFDRAMYEAKVSRDQRVLQTASIALGMAHELNNMLFGLSASVESLIDRDSQGHLKLIHHEPADERILLETILERTDQLKLVCTSLLDQSRRQSMSLAAFRDLLDAAVGACAPSASQFNVLLHVGPLPTVTRKYPLALMQVFINLILNAIQHTKDFRLGRGASIVRVTVAIDGSSLTIRIRDNGSGMTWDRRESIFAMYKSTRKSGSGLGLHVSRLIVENAGGTIEVEESLKFFGTTMLVTLPL
jgi:signal transduction histidine kinase/ActR/RegA family two-component response regulator